MQSCKILHKCSFLLLTYKRYTPGDYFFAAPCITNNSCGRAYWNSFHRVDRQVRSAGLQSVPDSPCYCTQILAPCTSLHSSKSLIMTHNKLAEPAKENIKLNAADTRKPTTSFNTRFLCNCQIQESTSSNAIWIWNWSRYLDWLGSGAEPKYTGCVFLLV